MDTFIVVPPTDSIIGSFSNDDGDSGDEFTFCLPMLTVSVQYAYRS